MKKQRIGTNELIVIHLKEDAAPAVPGHPWPHGTNPSLDVEAVFYVREFKGGEIRNVVEAKPSPGGWAATLEDGREKFFSQKWLETVFME
jgi:hypothetical protein